MEGTSLNDIFSAVGFNLYKVKSYANKSIKGSVYKVNGCKIVSIYTGELYDIDIDDFLDGLNSGKILNNNIRLKDLHNLEIRIHDDCSSVKFTIKGSLYNTGFYFYDLYLDDEVLIKSTATNLSLYSYCSSNVYRYIVYSLDTKDIFMYIRDNIAFSSNNIGFDFRYNYLDKELKQAHGIGLKELKICGDSVEINLDKFFNYYNASSNGIVYMDDICVITSRASGDIIINSNCKELYLGGHAYPNIKSLVIPKGIEKAVVTSSIYSNKAEATNKFDIYFSKNMDDNVKYEICRNMFGVVENKSTSYSFDVYREFNNIHMY